jgi:hypothetical protein
MPAETVSLKPGLMPSCALISEVPDLRRAEAASSAATVIDIRRAGAVPFAATVIDIRRAGAVPFAAAYLPFV